MASSSKSSAAGELAAVRLWPCARPLECGVISQVHPAREGVSRFSCQTLKKLLLYTKTKHSKSYPWMSYTVWSHLARSRLHMTDELAWLYFETFDVVSEVDIDSRVKMMEMMNRCATQEDRDLLRRKVNVDAPRFFLFLFLQNAPRHSLKASLISDDEWPSQHAEKRPQSSEYSYLEFLKSNISDILQLLSFTNSDSGREVISVKELSSLDFAVQGARGRAPLESLVELASLPTESLSSGYSEEIEIFYLSQLEQWLSSHLSLSPYGPHAIRSGSRDKSSSCFRSDTIGRIATNCTLATPTGQACVLLHKISKQTLAKEEEGLIGNTVHIDNCRSSRIYLLAPMKSVHIERCSHCLLVLGPVEVTVTLSNCDSLVLVVACRRLHITSCSLCNLHLLTATRPVISPPSRQLTFAPFNTHYPKLDQHLKHCGLSVTFNLWNQPLYTGISGGEIESEVWSELDPDLFRPFSIPFQLSGDTKANPCDLPTKYREALDRRKKRTSEWYKVVKDTGLTPQQAHQLQTRVKSHFKDWLDTTGHSREIRELELPHTSSSSSHGNNNKQSLHKNAATTLSDST